MTGQVTADEAGKITPEQQIGHLIQHLHSQVQGPSYPGRMRCISGTIDHLVADWALYVAGDLPTITPEEEGVSF